MLEVLKKARALVAQGWTQGTWWEWTPGTETGKSYCVMGAVEAVDMNCSQEAWDYLRNFIKGRPGMMAVWNDRDGRTQQEVLDLFDRAIAQLEDEQHQEDLERAEGEGMIVREKVPA